MVPKTPETRTPYVLALLAIIAAVNAALRWFVGFRYAPSGNPSSELLMSTRSFP